VATLEALERGIEEAEVRRACDVTSASELQRQVDALKAQNAELTAQNADLKDHVTKFSARIEELAAQVKWFQNQIFGKRSDRRIVDSHPQQLFLGEQFQKETTKEETQTVKEHKRKKRRTHATDLEDSSLFFDGALVPVEEIVIENPDIEGLSEDEYEVIDQRTSYRLAQRPGAYVILKYVRNVVKLKGDTNPQWQDSCRLGLRGQ